MVMAYLGGLAKDLYDEKSIKTLLGVNIMYINFILFKVYIEKYSNWSNLNITKDNYETILDIGYLRITSHN